MKKFIDWQHYLCGISTDWKNIKEYLVWICRNKNSNIDWFSFNVNGDCSASELPYRTTRWSNAYRVISVRKIK